MRFELAKGLRVSPDEGSGIGTWPDKISRFARFGLCWVVLQVLQHLRQLNQAWKSERGRKGWADEVSWVAYDLFCPGGSPPDLWITGFFLQQILLPCHQLGLYIWHTHRVESSACSFSPVVCPKWVSATLDTSWSLHRYVQLWLRLLAVKMSLQHRLQ